jgi:hypothetical protein
MAGTVPAGRAAHSACLIEPGGSIVVFGGTNGQRPFDELWLLHVHSSRWEQLRLPSSLHKPTARSYHSAAVVGGEMLIWGGVRPGRDEGCSISAGSDVHVFSLEKRSWALHLVSDELHLVGGGRSSHTAVAHRDKVHTTRCALRVHCMCTACALHVHYTLHAHCTSTHCTLHMIAARCLSSGASWPRSKAARSSAPTDPLCC